MKKIENAAARISMFSLSLFGVYGVGSYLLYCIVARASLYPKVAILP